MGDQCHDEINIVHTFLTMEHLVAECKTRLQQVRTKLEGTPLDHSQLQSIATKSFENLDSNGKEVMGIQLKDQLIDFSVSNVD
jgi:hypothetical protein